LLAPSGRKQAQGCQLAFEAMRKRSQPEHRAKNIERQIGTALTLSGAVGEDRVRYVVGSVSLWNLLRDEVDTGRTRACLGCKDKDQKMRVWRYGKRDFESSGCGSG
jgi:isocitrate lyase